MKNLPKFKKLFPLKRSELKKINGGSKDPCPTGCYDDYFSTGYGDCGVSTFPGGFACAGIEVNGQCCI